MRPERFGGPRPARIKAQVVRRVLAGEATADVAHETGTPPKQLAAWCRRFTTGGEAALRGQPKDTGIKALQDAQSSLLKEVAELKSDNLMLSRRLSLLSSGSARSPHPYCSSEYSLACEEHGVTGLHVPGWDSYVLVRPGRGGSLQATGARPLASLDPGCDVRAGLDSLQSAGIKSVSLVADPMWSPELSILQQAFTSCRAFRQHFVVDREAPSAIRKRHRNKVSQARRACEIHEVALGEHLERWLELYDQNVISHRISQPFTAAYFAALARMPELQAHAVLVGGKIEAMTLWLRHEDTVYFHDGASSAAGLATHAAYAAFAHAIEGAGDCRFVFLGGSAGMQDEPLDGLAMFKRGFANFTLCSYLCHATLSASTRVTVDVNTDRVRRFGRVASR